MEPGEEVDLPVLFMVEVCWDVSLQPEFLDDKHMDDINVLTLSYTFFRSYSEEEEAEMTT